MKGKGQGSQGSPLVCIERKGLKELGLLFKTKQEKDISCNETAVCEG